MRVNYGKEADLFCAAVLSGISPISGRWADEQGRSRPYRRTYR
jgi:hypothetical protein